MKRILVSAFFLATLVCPCFAAIDAFIWFTPAGGGKVQKFEITDLQNPSVSAYEFKTGQMTAGHRKWKPFSITRKIDQASPIFFRNASAGTGTVKVVVQHNVNGVSKPWYTITLTGAKGTKTGSQSNELESFNFTFTKITWTWNDGGKTASDDWEARV